MDFFPFINGASLSFWINSERNYVFSALSLFLSAFPNTPNHSFLLRLVTLPWKGVN